MSESSGSHCSMVSERPRLLNHFTLHVAPNATFAPFISTTVDIPNPNDFTYELNPSVAATSFMTKSSHYTIGNWMPRRLVRCSDAIHFVVLPFDARCAPWLAWDVTHVSLCPYESVHDVRRSLLHSLWPVKALIKPWGPQYLAIQYGRCLHPPSTICAVMEQPPCS